jgi:polysaccharide deacetylase family sporulation protein PdaB
MKADRGSDRRKSELIKEFTEELQDSEISPESGASVFIRVGIVVLSIIMLIGLGIMIIPNAVTVSNISSKRDLPIYSVNTEDKEVALTFDTAWGNEDLQNILDTLKKHNIKATFFLTGSWVEKYPDDVKAIVKAGHDVGNHSEQHRQMIRMDQQECAEEIMKVHDRVKNLTGIDMSLFRAPYGEYNNLLVGTARECGYHTIQWDVDSEDWKDYGVDSIVKSVVDNKNLGNGSIILLHNDAKYTPQALEDVITGLQEKGYELVPVSELIYTGKYTVDGAGRQFTR